MIQGKRKQRRPLYYFFMVSVGIFLSTMDSSMVNIALPYIMEDFAVSLVQAQWIVLVYLLVICITLLIWGKISDSYSKGGVYLFGMGVFSTGALCCSFAPNLALLIGSRLIQGAGAAMMMATGPAIIRLVAPKDQLGKWLGSLGIATSIGLMSGPLIGGIILHNAGWRTIFLVYVPVSIIPFILGWLYLAGTLPKVSRVSTPFDIYGALLWGGVIAVTVILLSFVEFWNIQITLAVFAVLILLTYLFFHVESEKDEPLFPIALFRQRYYLIGMTVVALSFNVLFFVLILMPLYLKFVAGAGYDRIGYMMMAVPASLFIVSPLAGRLYDRLGGVYLTSLGLAVSGCAVLLLAHIDQATSLLAIAWQLALLGCGQSIFLSPNSASVLSRVAVEDTGITAGVLATSRNLGMLLGVALVTLIFSSLFGVFSGGVQLNEYTSEHLPAFLRAFRYSLFIAATISFSSALLSLARK